MNQQVARPKSHKMHQQQDEKATKIHQQDYMKTCQHDVVHGDFIFDYDSRVVHIICITFQIV